MFFPDGDASCSLGTAARYRSAMHRGLTGRCVRYRSLFPLNVFGQVDHWDHTERYRDPSSRARTVTCVNTPAGWYPDPSDPSKDRFWDGVSWTSDVRAAGGGNQPDNPALGALFDPPSRSRGSNPASWWEEEDEEPQSTMQSPTQSPIQAIGESEDRPHHDAPTRNRRGSGRISYRSLLTRVGAGALIVTVLFVARAEQQRSEMPTPAVVDNLPTAPLEPSTPADPTGISVLAPDEADPGVDTGTGSGLDGLPNAEVDAAQMDPATPTPATPKPTSTTSSPKPPTREPRPTTQPVGVPTKVRFHGSSFGPNGLLAVSWSAPTKAPSGMRYLVEVKYDGAVKRIRTSSTEALFRNVGAQDCTVRISAYTSAGSSPVVTFRCGS